MKYDRWVVRMSVRELIWMGEGGGGLSSIKYSIAKGRGGESGEMISILHRDVPASYYRVP